MNHSAIGARVPFVCNTKQDQVTSRIFVATPMKRTPNDFRSGNGTGARGDSFFLFFFGGDALERNVLAEKRRGETTRHRRRPCLHRPRGTPLILAVIVSPYEYSYKYSTFFSQGEVEIVSCVLFIKNSRAHSRVKRDRREMQFARFAPRIAHLPR